MPLLAVDAVSPLDATPLELVYTSLIAAASLVLLLMKMQMGRFALTLAPVLLLHSGRTLVKTGRIFIRLSQQGEIAVGWFKRVRDGIVPNTFKWLRDLFQMALDRMQKKERADKD